jgi:Amt family ammonium transporter
VVQTWAACIVGFLSGLAYYGGSRLFLYMHIDDPVNAAAVHFCCGSVGGLSVGIFATEKGISAAYGILKPRAQGLIYSGDFTLLGTQVRLRWDSALWSYLREARTSISPVEGS